MTKYRTLGPGDGITGPTGLEYRNLTNDMIPGDAYFVPEDFVWTGDLAAYTGKILLVTYEHAVSGTITLPLNSTILFEGGAFTGTFTLVGTNSKIKNFKNTACLPLTVTFSGTWTNTEATPQWFGAVCSPNPKTLPGEMVVGGNVSYNARNEGGAVSSSAAIQKLFDSPFQPIFPPGYYYITAPTVITRQVYVDFGTPVMEMIDEMSTFYYKNDHVRFYTDQNVKFWEIRKHNVFLIGGVMDVQLCDTYDEDIYYAHADYLIQRGEASGYAIGNLTNARREGATGTYFRWDTTNTTRYGYITGFNIKTRINYIPKGIIVDDPQWARDQGSFNTWANGFTIDAFIDGAKFYADIRAGVSKAEIIGQTREVLNESEKDNWGIYLKVANPVSVFVWDTNANIYPSGYYRHNVAHAIYNASRNAIMYDWSFVAKRGNQIKGYPMQGPAIIDPDVDMQLLRNTQDSDIFISELHNVLPIMAKVGSYSINAYDGSTVNFDTDFDDGATLGLSAASNITITNPLSLSQFRKSGTNYSVGAGANLDTDFVEIVFNHPSGVYAREVFVYLTQNATAVKRIQLITVSQSDTVKMEEYKDEVHANYSKRYYDFRRNEFTWYKKVMIRLIGHTAASGPIYIADVAMKGAASTSQNYVNRFEIPYMSFHALLNQSGTDAPTMAIRLNSMSDTYTPSCSYQGVGSYRLNYSYQFPADKMLPVSLTLYTDLGKIVITRATDSYYTIQTYDTNDSPANGILVNQPIILNRYW